MQHVCPGCGKRVRCKYEGNGVPADADLVPVFVEHDPCPMSLKPVKQDAPPPPRILAEPVVKRRYRGR